MKKIIKDHPDYDSSQVLNIIISQLLVTQDTMQQICAKLFNKHKKYKAGNHPLLKVFRKSDQDHDGVLDQREFVACLRNFGVVLAKPELEHVFCDVNKSGSGTISFREFQTALKPLTKRYTVKEVSDAFGSLFAEKRASNVGGADKKGIKGELKGATQVTIVLTIPAELEARTDAMWEGHAAWMAKSHYRTGDKQLKSYTISKGKDLKNNLDVSSGETGRFTYILNEYYAAPAGLKDHWQQATEKPSHAWWDEWLAISGSDGAVVTAQNFNTVVQNIW